MKMASEEAERGVVIVGGGICGLATALALHRNGIASVVLEKCKNLRSTGAAIILQPNGWRALDHLGLGIASLLRRTSLPIHSGRYVSVDGGAQRDVLMGSAELRCVKRMDLMKSLAGKLPSGTLRLGCHVSSIELDPLTRRPLLQLQDGNVLLPQVVIGCDGVNSIVANAVGLSPPRTSSMCVVRGLTTFENGHRLKNEFIVLAKDGLQLGRMPIDDKQVYWFMTRKWTPRDLAISKDSLLIRRSSVECLSGFPTQERDMVARSDLSTLHLTDLKYRAPWDLLGASFQRGPIVVAGDAMHAMGPFLAQGGSAALEDAIVLGRCLFLTDPPRHPTGVRSSQPSSSRRRSAMDIEEALSEFVALRRRRVVRLSAQTYLTGLLVQNSSLVIVKFAIGVVIAILFGDGTEHTSYDCGSLTIDKDYAS